MTNGIISVCLCEYIEHTSQVKLQKNTHNLKLQKANSTADEW
jgi:hypothetical protein